MVVYVSKNWLSELKCLSSVCVSCATWTKKKPQQRITIKKLRWQLKMHNLKQTLLSFQWYITLDWAKAPGKGTGGKGWAIRDQYMARAQYWRTSSCIVLSYSKNTPMDIKIFWHGAMEIPRGDPELWDGNFNLTYPNFCLSNSWKQPQKETYSEI